ncbi:MAG: hypothetical protein CFE43_02835 [Burkholderiales bacterium PBB3]|nr:MAG: hypothetical protein CFE43_02835 [Burkholderiales bacterium PBB3]
MKKLVSILMAAFLASVSVGAMAAAHGGAMKDVDCKMDEKKMDDKTKAACKKMADDKKAADMKKEEPKK